MGSIGMFKLPYALNKPYHQLPKLFDEKNTQLAEEFAASHLGTYLMNKENHSVSEWFINPNDKNKGADVIGKIDGITKGIQITQFVLNNYLSRFNQAKKLCLSISEDIARIYNPSIKINVQIFGADKRKDIIPVANSKTFKKLAKIIAEKIEENIKKIINNEDDLIFPVGDKDLEKITPGFHLQQIPPLHYSSYFGCGNIFIDYGFDDIFIAEGDLQKEAERIYEKKNGGKSEILLIWSETKQLMDKGNEACEILRQVFHQTTFESIYFMSFDNVKGFQNKIYMIKIK